MDDGHCIRVPGVYSAGVLCNAEGKPVGVTCLEEIDLDPAGLPGAARISWRTPACRGAADAA